MDNLHLFEQRKRDHIRIALEASSQAVGESMLDQIQLMHEALPEIDFAEIIIESEFLHKPAAPLFVSSMTAGHHDGLEINIALARACERKNWLMGVGSQRRQLSDENARAEWQKIRNEAPRARLIGNLGLAQVISEPVDKIRQLIDSLNAEALFIHTNPLQEAFQPEGTPQFRGGLVAIENLCKQLHVPIILKETGCGFSPHTLRRLQGLGLYAVDVAGLGGTHWGRVEGARSAESELLHKAAKTFANWGVSTVESLAYGLALQPGYALWASGGVRSGLDAAKFLAMGADKVGFAKPMIEAALNGVDEVISLMNQIEYELKVALFCTGCKNLSELKHKKVWKWKGELSCS